MVVANAVAGLAEISQTCGKDLLDLDRGNIPKLLAWKPKQGEGLISELCVFSNIYDINIIYIYTERVLKSYLDIYYIVDN